MSRKLNNNRQQMKSAERRYKSKQADFAKASKTYTGQRMDRIEKMCVSWWTVKVRGGKVEVDLK